MTSSTIRGVIFDLGSTLIDFGGDYASVFPESLAAITDHLLAEGISLGRAEFIDQFSQALRDYDDRRDDDHIELTTYAILCDVLRTFVESLPDEAVLRDALSAMYAVSEVFWKPKANMHAVLNQLSGSGYQLGLLSNAGDEANVQRLIDKVGIRDYFDPILISAALGIRKPDPRPFQQILEEWTLPPESVVMVGDLLEADILGAQQTGIHNIWLRDGSKYDSSDHAQELQPEFIAEDLGEIPDLIMGISKKG
jgi:putative hydrolase of the HAD superfamily